MCCHWTAGCSLLGIVVYCCVLYWTAGDALLGITVYCCVLSLDSWLFFAWYCGLLLCVVIGQLAMLCLVLRSTAVCCYCTAGSALLGIMVYCCVLLLDSWLYFAWYHGLLLCVVIGQLALLCLVSRSTAVCCYWTAGSALIGITVYCCVLLLDSWLYFAWYYGLLLCVVIAQLALLCFVLRSTAVCCYCTAGSALLGITVYCCVLLLDSWLYFAWYYGLLLCVVIEQLALFCLVLLSTVLCCYWTAGSILLGIMVYCRVLLLDSWLYFAWYYGLLSCVVIGQLALLCLVLWSTAVCCYCTAGSTFLGITVYCYVLLLYSWLYFAWYHGLLLCVVIVVQLAPLCLVSRSTAVCYCCTAGSSLLGITVYCCVLSMDS